MRELSILSIGQRKILNTIAEGQTKGLTSKKIIKKLDLTSSSILEAIRMLIQKDYIEQLENDHYRIIDPLIKDTLFFYSHQL